MGASNRRNVINQGQVTLNVSPNVISTSSIAGGSLIKAYSPTVTATEVEGGFQITITDVNGTRTIMVHHGYQGEQGFSPEVSMTATDSGVNLTITDESGEHTILIPKGDHGDRGDPGLPPIIEDGYWYLWDESTEQYINTEIPVHQPLSYDDEPTDDSDNLLTSGTIKAALDEKLDAQDVPTNVSELVNDAGYLTQHQDISGKADIADIPTNVSELVNDAGYLTSHQDISGKADVADIPTKVSDLDNDAGYLTSHQDISGKADVSDIPTKVSDLTNDAGFISSYTETDPTVPSWAKSATKPSYTAQEVGAMPSDTVIPTKTSDLTNDSGFLTEHQDISGKQDVLTFDTTPTSGSINPITSGGVYAAISDINTMDIHICSAAEYNSETGMPTISNPDSKTFYLVPGGSFSNLYIEWVYVNNTWEQFGSATIDLTPYALSADLADVATSGSYNDLSNKPSIPTKVSDLTNDAGYLTAHQDISGKADIEDIPTKVSDLTNDAGYLTSHQDISGKADLADIPTKVSDLVDDSGHYTKPSGGIPASDLASGVIPDLTNYVQKTDYATSSTFGVVKLTGALRSGSEVVGGSSDAVYIVSTSVNGCKNGTSDTFPVTPSVEHAAAFYGLAKAAGDSTQSVSNNAVGVYTDDAKNAIRAMIGAVGTTDYASVSNAGVVKADAYNQGIGITDGKLALATTTDGVIAAGTSRIRSVMPYQQHISAFYGLAKAAGDTTQVASSNAVGTYTDTAKDKIQQMLGIDNLIAQHEDYATATSAISTNDLFMMSGKLYKATVNIAANGTITPGTNCDEVSIDDAFVKKTDIATSSAYGVIKTSNNYGTAMTSGGVLYLYAATDSDISGGTKEYRPITAQKQHRAVFYGLAKAAGDTTQASSSNSVGTYTDNAKAAIRNMIGAGISNITDAIIGPETSSEKSVVTNGIIKISTAFSVNNSNELVLNAPPVSTIKSGTSTVWAVTPSTQHAATFYGLAKAAGDTTQSSSSNAVGTYTNAAKNAIKTMLDAGTITETVSGSTPTVTAAANHRYICGEVTALSFTPCVSGICDIRFTSGSTVTVLTVPNTVKWPGWFDPTSLEANTVYEINVEDGVYGVVTTWAT